MLIDKRKTLSIIYYMKKLKTLLAAHRTAIIWTACYIIATWALLYFLFKFNIFNAQQWQHLAQARLRGFPGFVFGILLLAAPSLYIATTTLIIRTKKPLFTIPLPKMPQFFKRTIATPTSSDTTPPPSSTDDETSEPESELKLPDDLPAELHSTFKRALSHPIYNIPTPTPSDIDQTDSDSDTTNTTDVTDISPDLFPIPSDFDIEIPDPEFDAAPTFTDINFDAPQSPTITESPDIPPYAISDKLFDHLASQDTPYEIDQEIILTPTHSISVHNDPDFWVADSENWFAAGKTRPSPIAATLQSANARHTIPTLYLETQNIMDLDQLIPEWESMGITVITDPSNL